MTSILLVTANARIRDGLGSLLEERGYEVVRAGNGAEGLSLAQSSGAVAILVDDALPDIEGAAVVRKLREHNVDTLCLLLTATLERAAQPEVLESGSDAYLLSTLPTEEMATRLSALMGRGLAIGRELAVQERPPRILAVDDSDAALELLALAFQPDGYDIILAHSGPEALEILERESVDCVLLDLMMPGMTGHEVCTQIKANSSLRGLPVLMLTVREDEETMLASIDAGADDYIVKSSSFQIVRARVRSQLRRRAYEAENRRIREALHHKELESIRERAAREFAQSGAVALAELDRLKDEFLSIVSHDLRTPLAVISGAVSNVLSGVTGPITDDQRTFLEMAKQSVSRLNSMIVDLLDLSRIQAGALVLRQDKIDLVAAVREIVSETEQIATGNGVRIRAELPEEQVPTVADAGRIAQVVSNLLSNACRFAETEVVVRLAPDGNGSLILVVEDDGPGIPAEAFPQLFKRFSRVEGAGGKSKTGLGLSIVDAIVTAHGGSVRAENRLDERDRPLGARFVVQLPREGPESHPSRTTELLPTSTRVLLVEGEEAIRQIVVARLRALGCEVLEAADGETALLKIAERRPDLIVLDVGLPGISGFELADRLSASGSAPPILFLTAQDDPRARRRGRELGAVGYMTKPFDPAELAREVRMLLRVGDAESLDPTPARAAGSPATGSKA